MLDLDGISLTQEENKLLPNPHVGGVILFAEISLQEIKFKSYVSNQKYKSRASYCSRSRGGKVQRLKEGYTILPTMQKLAAFLNSDSDKNFPFATDLGWLMASEVIASGLDISFAPC